MKRRYFKRNCDNAIYYTGEDQNRNTNLINMRSGSEMFCLRNYWEEMDFINETMTEISRDEALKQIPDPYGNHSIN